MNCKPGDLAIVTGRCAAQGAIVEVVRPLRLNCYVCGSHEWLVLYRGELIGACDQELRPIRGDEGADETMAWAGKSADIETPVVA